MSDTDFGTGESQGALDFYRPKNIEIKIYLLQFNLTATYSAPHTLLRSSYSKENTHDKQYLRLGR